MKKIVSLLIAISLTVSYSAITYAAEAKEEGKENMQILVENGYTIETAESLPMSVRDEMASFLVETPEKIQISLVSMEVDALEGIEAMAFYSEDELVNMGAERTKVQQAKEEIKEYENMNLEVLAEKMKISTIEAEMIKKAIAAGRAKEKETIKKEQNVFASGSLSSSKISYVQTVMDYSSATAPVYDVYLTYAWKQLYYFGTFDDSIVVAWGGDLNSRNYATSAQYYLPSGGEFTSYTGERSMQIYEEINEGVQLSFPQTYNSSKTKKGYANFSIYQNKFNNFDTKVTSHYCHKIATIGGAGITFKGDGNVEVTSMYDKTAQLRHIITT